MSRPPGSKFGSMALSPLAGAVYASGDRAAKIPVIVAESPAQRAVPRETLWLAWRALESLLRASGGRLDSEKFELAREEGARVLALGPRLG